MPTFYLPYIAFEFQPQVKLGSTEMSVPAAISICDNLTAAKAWLWLASEEQERRPRSLFTQRVVTSGARQGTTCIIFSLSLAGKLKKFSLILISSAFFQPYLYF